MLRIFSILILILTSQQICAAEPELRYVDASTLTIIGQALPTGHSFDRIDTTRYTLPKMTRFYCTSSTGLAVLFKTDSPTIQARWTTTDKQVGPNMTAIAQKGLDLYIRRDGVWVYAGVGQPTIDGRNDTHNSQIVSNLPACENECLLYLPLYDRVLQLEIGIDVNSHIEALPNQFRHKIVVHGSSITHGSSASRAGMSYVARLGRDLGLYCINLGFSGQCTMQPEFAAYLADVDADAFIFDCFSNPKSEWIAERFGAFVERIRTTHPTTPLIFMQTEVRESCTFNSKAAEYEKRKRIEAEKQVRNRMKSDKNIYFVNPGELLGTDHLGTVDGIHPTDMGFERMLNQIEPQICKILKKHGIR